MKERGFGLVFLAATMVPIIVMVAAAATAMSSRNARLLGEIMSEKALQAAEAGIDIAIYQANLGALKSGVRIERDLGSGLSCSIEPLNVHADGQDNDGDGEIDEADENVFQLTVRGTYANTSRRLRAFIRISRTWSFDSAVLIQNPNIQSLDTATLIAAVQANADVNLVARYSDVTPFDFGDASANDWRLLYREGDLQITKKGYGAGILVVTGKLQIDNDFRFDGIVIVQGDIQLQQDVEIHGTLIQAGNQIQMADRCQIQYSREAVNGAIGALSPGGVYPFGWREISKS